MKEIEARAIYKKLCDERGCQPTSNGARPEPGGSWRFVEREEPGPNGAYVGAVVRADGKAFSFFGALGKVFRNCPALGLPTSGEQTLGGTAFGRYQITGTTDKSKLAKYRKLLNVTLLILLVKFLIFEIADRIMFVFYI